MRKTVLGFGLAAACAAPAHADTDAFSAVRNKAEFVSLISGKALTRFGIRLEVSPAGQITGSAFGQQVKGAWTWQGGLFCRELAFGGTDLARNCQLVQRKGEVLRFTSDAGKGDHADLRLK